MSQMIACPSCHSPIEVTEILRAQITAEVRSENEAAARRQQAELSEMRRKLDAEQEAIESAREDIQQQVKNLLETQRSELLAKAKREAMQAVGVEMKDRETELSELKSKLSEANNRELAFRKRERELETAKKELELEVARQIDAERTRIRDEAKQQLDEEHQLKDAEKDKKISDLAAKIKDLQRKVEQGSQQLQGEVQELVLEQLLETAFPSDRIEPIAKGVSGGDNVQRVLNNAGTICGSILWESKRTKNWSNAWLAKARDDQRTARTDCVVIVTEAMPECVRNFEKIEGVWVCSWSAAKALATVLRFGLLEVGKARIAMQDQHEKTELVYNYLTGTEFQQRVNGVVEALISMQSDLDSEKRSTKRLWSKREKQILRAVGNLASFYGDLQGFIGTSLPTIEGLDVPRIGGATEMSETDEKHVLRK
jgi:hypothetical protein